MKNRNEKQRQTETHGAVCICLFIRLVVRSFDKYYFLCATRSQLHQLNESVSQHFVGHWNNLLLKCRFRCGCCYSCFVSYFPPILSSWLSSTDYYCYRMSSSSDSNPKSIRNKLKLKSFNNNRRTTNIHFVFPFCSYQFMIALVHQPHLCFAKSIWNIRVLRLTSQKYICCSPSLSFSLVRSQSKKWRELVSRLLRFPICVTIIVIIIVVILVCLVRILWCQLACLLAQSNVV